MAVEVKSGKQLINTIYLNKKNANSNYSKIILITKDEKGNKNFDVIEKPQFTFAITKEEYWDGKVRNYIEKEKVKYVKCYYDYMVDAMDKNLNDSNFSNMVQSAKNSGYDSWNKIKDLHLDYRFHLSDKNIQDFYIDNFLKSYPQDDETVNNFFGLTKAFFDIEVDSSEIEGFPDPEKAEAPINTIGLFDEQTYTLHSFNLMYEHDGYFEVMDNKDKFIEELREKYRWIEEKLGIEIKYEIYEFNSEIELIQEFFNLINYEIKPDFLSAWNVSYDFCTIHNRILKLGYDPAEIMCPEEFPYKYVSYKLDERNQDPSEKNDTYTLTGYTMIVDLMCLYASLTKASGKRESYSLDYIGELETGMTKDVLETSIKTAHFDNYRQFLTYNIQDVIMLFMIELKTKHLDAIYSLAMMTRTRLDKTMKKTVSIRNYAELFYRKNGYVMSNNHSKLYPRTGEKIKGALTYKRTLNLLNCWNILRALRTTT